MTKVWAVIAGVAIGFTFSLIGVGISESIQKAAANHDHDHDHRAVEYGQVAAERVAPVVAEPEAPVVIESVVTEIEYRIGDVVIYSCPEAEAAWKLAQESRPPRSEHQYVTGLRATVDAHCNI